METVNVKGVPKISPTSVDIRLGFIFDVFNTIEYTHLDFRILEKQVKKYTRKVHIQPMKAFVLHPGEFVLGSTLEYFIFPADLAGRIEGRSSWGRIGLEVHATAGFVDPGYEGSLTFELSNSGKVPIELYPGLRIAQICFFQTMKTCIPYTKKPEAKYQRLLDSKSSRVYLDEEFKAISRFKRREKNGVKY